MCHSYLCLLSRVSGGGRRREEVRRRSRIRKKKKRGRMGDEEMKGDGDHGGKLTLALASLALPLFSTASAIRREAPIALPRILLFLSAKINPEPGGLAPELANQGEIILEVEDKNKRLVRALYEALNNRDVETVHRLLAPDIEWWFHGPPSCQHMMRLLTGASPDDSFLFDPVSVAAFGSTVVVEGQGCGRATEAPLPWIHAWTVTDGIITQVREYFNTSLTVTRLGPPESSTPSPCGSGKSRASSSSSSTSQLHCKPLWESRLSGGAGKKSVPGLVLAI